MLLFKPAQPDKRVQVSMSTKERWKLQLVELGCGNLSRGFYILMSATEAEITKHLKNRKDLKFESKTRLTSIED